MAQRESPELAAIRWQKLEILQEHYKDFIPFLTDVMTYLGFNTTEIQESIAEFLQYGPSYKMIQAQRGQAKSTITAIYAVWRLIHRPKERVLIVSAGGPLATAIARLCIRIIETMDVLECLRPDKAAGDLTSFEEYDVHHSLKGVEKSASLTCIGITGTMQGKRADLLIADDVESSKNSQTALMRERLLHLTLDFTSINQAGDIIYLGTPQTMDSIYNSLPGRGFTVQIWPGRYPNLDQRARYGGFLATWITKRLEANPSLGTGGGPTGTDGQPTDPIILPEAILIKKELDQGRSYFMLQHMLMTDLADEEKFPLKLKNLMIAPMSREKAAVDLLHMPAPQQLITLPMETSVPNAQIYDAIMQSELYQKYEKKLMFIDPAGGGANGDETAWCVAGFIAGYIYIMDIGGIKGGYNPEQMDFIVKTAYEWDVSSIVIEPNFGYGAFANVLLPYLRKESAKQDGKMIGVEDGEFATAMKEQRICDAIEPVLNTHKLVFNKEILTSDVTSTKHHSPDRRKVFQLLFQMAHIYREKGALLHDDRVDVLHQAVRYFAKDLARDALKEREKQEQAEMQKWFADPLGRGKPNTKTRVAPAIQRMKGSR